MKKRLCSLLLVLTMLSTLLVAPASALEADGSTSAGNETYVYLGVKDYGTVEADSKPNFVHRFYTNGEEVQYTIASSDNKYAVQNKLQEGYVYDLTIEGGVVTDAAAATADAEGTIASIDDSTVTVNGAAVKYSAIYEISNNAAGATAVAAVTDLTALVGKTAKVYGDTVYLTFIAEPYTAPVSGTPGERTLKNYLQTAMNPVGTALYVYGGSWDWQDVNSSNQALTIGLPQSWIDFFQQQDANYTYKNSADPAHSYYPHNSWNQYYYAGVDCSAYIGWTVYNVMHTESTTNDLSDGYVMSAVKMAKTFADKGWGTWTRDIKSFKPGDIFSMSGHVWTVLGVCDDGSIVFLHSTPSDSKAGQGGGGVQLSALNPNSDDDKNCEAYKLVTKYMTKYYPEWSERYDAVLRSYISYATPATGTKYKETWSGNFSWNLDGTGLTDPDGYADMSAAEILADLFGEVNGSYENAVYLGVKNYGTVSSKNPGKDNFIHRFFADGKVVEFKVANDGRYSIQNTLQEGYVYDLTVENSVVTAASAAASSVEGTIASIDDSTVTVNGAAVKYSAIYYYPHNSWNQYYYAGLDCSGYVGWVVYNVMHTQNSVNTDNDGYVMSSTKMAKTFADKGWGTWTRDIKSFKPGDIFSMSGHVWTVLGVCDDGSIVFLHSTPSDSKAGQGGGGVQLSALNPNSDDDKNCEAYKLVTKYMTKYYPEWSERYDAVLRSYDSYAAPATGSPFKETWSGNFSWNLDGTGLTDPDGYADMSAAEILADLFGDAETQPSTPVIPSQPSTPVRPSQPSQPEQPSQKGFNDVKPGDYFYDAVNWAVEKGITTGTSATTFSPNASCTRAQIVTFLWRASGSPEPKTASNPFTDVAANAYYCKAVLWAVENGITTGTSATTFSPDAPCTRAQGVTFLWRANGSKAASAAASFTDVASDAYYAPAVAWAAEQNVTSGVGNGLFSSDTICTRAQIVSMLYRLR